jgi:hypothetical protein
MPVSKPDLPIDPLPGPGHLAPVEDCLVVFAWIGCQSCGEKDPVPRIEDDGHVYFRGNSVNGLPNAAIQFSPASSCICWGALRLTQSL